MTDELLPDIEVGRYALRTFKLRDGKLGSLFQSFTWDDGTAIATCLGKGKGGKHEAPAENCHCGLYGTLTLEHLESQYRSQALNCVAVMAAEGVTYLGDKGLRTAAARIVAYWVAPPQSQVHDGPDPDGMGPFWRAGEGLLQKPAKSGIEDQELPDPLLEAFQKTCPQAQHFRDIHAMLAEFSFPAFEGTWPPVIPTPRPEPSPMYPQISYKLGGWESVAAHMKAATPQGIAVVKALLEGKII